MISVKQRGASC